MTKHEDVSRNFATIGAASLAVVEQSSTGQRPSEIGSGKPLAVSEELSRLKPEETDERVLQRLTSIVGRRPALRTRLMIPEEGQTYRTVEGVDWHCPESLRDACLVVVEGSFRSAPEDRLGAALYRMRILTRGRDQRSDQDREAEAMIWLEQLRCWPADVALETVRTWPTKSQWWPTWQEIENELRIRTAPRKALANFLLKPPGEPKMGDEVHIVDDASRARVDALVEQFKGKAQAKQRAAEQKTAEEHLASLKAIVASGGSPLSQIPPNPVLSAKIQEWRDEGKI